MLSFLMTFLFSNYFYMALHYCGKNSFPKPLSAAQEKQCFEELGSAKEESVRKNAKDQLILHNLRLVAHVIKKYYYHSEESEDLISIGTIGLIKAVSAFQYDKGIRFATYASKCIENEILMYFRSAKKNSQDVFINDAIDTDKDGNSLTLVEKIIDQMDIAQETETKIQVDQMLVLMNRCLSPREKQILILRYGLHGRKPMTQKNVARGMKISRSYVSRIEKKALEKLKESFEQE